MSKLKEELNRLREWLGFLFSQQESAWVKTDTQHVRMLAPGWVMLLIVLWGERPTPPVWLQPIGTALFARCGARLEIRNP